MAKFKKLRDGSTVKIFDESACIRFKVYPSSKSDEECLYDFDPEPVSGIGIIGGRLYADRCEIKRTSTRVLVQQRVGLNI